MTQGQDPDLRRKVLSSLAWLGSAQLLGQLASWTSTIVVIRLLDPSEYGVMALAAVFLSFLLMLSDLGIGAAVVQAEEIDEEDARFIQGFILIFNVAGFAVTLLGSGFIARFYGEPRLGPVLDALSVCFLLMAIYALPQAMLQRELSFERKAKVDLATLIASALASLCCALLGFGVWALVAGTIVTHGVRAVGFSLAWRFAPLPRISYARTARFLRFGGIIVVDRILWFFYSNLDVIIAGKLLDGELVGIYSVALTLSSLPLAKVMPIVTQVSFSAFSRIQRDRERVHDGVVRAIRYAGLLFLPIFWGMALVSADGIPLVLGERWQRVVLPLQLICVILPLKAIAALLPPALFGIGRPLVNVVNMAISLAVMSVAFYVGAQSGPAGLASAWLVGFPVAFAIIAARALPVLGVSRRTLWRSLRAALTAGAAMAAAVLFVQILAPDLTPILRLLASVTCGALTYVAVVLRVDRRSIDELRNLLTGQGGG